MNRDCNEKKKVLVAEDDKFISRAFTDCLRRAGFEVSVAFDGIEATEKINTELPDLVLLDLILPQKNGFEVLGDAKTNDKVKNIPIVIISNLDQDSDIQKSKQLGAVDYLVKSNLTLEKLVAKIKFHLQANHQTQFN